MGDLCAQHSPLLSELLVKHEDGMVIETTVPGIYHVDAAIFLERVEDGRNDNLPAQIDFPPLFPGPSRYCLRTGRYGTTRDQDLVQRMFASSPKECP